MNAPISTSRRCRLKQVWRRHVSSGGCLSNPHVPLHTESHSYNSFSNILSDVGVKQALGLIVYYLAWGLPEFFGGWVQTTRGPVPVSTHRIICSVGKPDTDSFARPLQLLPPLWSATWLKTGVLKMPFAQAPANDGRLIDPSQCFRRGGHRFSRTAGLPLESWSPPLELLSWPLSVMWAFGASEVMPTNAGVTTIAARPQAFYQKSRRAVTKSSGAEASQNTHGAIW